MTISCRPIYNEAGEVAGLEWCVPICNNQGEPDMASNATPNGEFTKFGIHLTKDEMDAVRIGIVPDSVLPQLEAALPIVVELSEGMIYRYPGGQTYEIVRIGEEDVILRRVCGFVTVETGTTFAESRAKVEQHFASESKGIEVLTDVTTTYIYV